MQKDKYSIDISSSYSCLLAHEQMVQKEFYQRNDEIRYLYMSRGLSQTDTPSHSGKRNGKTL